MNVSRWHMNRMGLVDFWCYENEVFDFENGHMLLRGSNGSGKSVTMQSFIPLLLDGNKSSERLDPFGTRSRKMETYLIDENSSRNERIGYLYLEFKREDSEVYKTIGMGLRARKGKALDSWYFVIEDNRRINIDFSLIENRLTLTEKQLKNILGEQVILSQKEYMRRVNDALFGFESLEDYGDAITLLLQLRSPKLSNSLSPQKINEILEKSLQPLSDEDLRPMSEAIVNMDNLQDQLENLKQSLDAAHTLEHVYQNYNKALLLEKWQKYNKEEHYLHDISQRIQQKEKQQQEYANQIQSSKHRLNENRIEYEVKKSELASMKNTDIDLWIETIRELDKDISEYQKELNKKIKTHEQKEELYQDTKTRIENYQAIIDDNEYLCQKTLHELDTLNESLSLSEHIALKDCFNTHTKNFDFSYTRQILKNTMHQIQHGLELWQDYDNQSQHIEFFENEESQKQDQLIELQSKIEQGENAYQQKIEEYLENYHRYNTHNKILKFSNEDMEKMRLSLIDYEMTRNYLSIQKIVENVYKKIYSFQLQEQAKLSTIIKDIENQIGTLQQEKNHLESLEDLEPEKTPENILNRQYLSQKHIPYISLYQVLDFDSSLDEKSKQRIEELLSKMQLLDALIIPKQYQTQVLEFPLGCQDFYLWTNKNIQELKTVMISKLDNQEDFIELLSSLSIETNRFININEKYFQSGIIEGSLALNKEAIYIGYESRLQRKKAKIEKYQQQISQYEQLKQTYLEKVDSLQQQMSLLSQEYEMFIDENELKNALDNVEILRRNYTSLQTEIDDIHQMIIKQYEQLKVIYHQIQSIASDLLLPVQKQAFHLYKDDLQEYQNQFEDFKDHYISMMTHLDLKNVQEDKCQRLIEDIDELNYEIEQYQYKNDISVQKRASIQKKLDDAGYQNIAHQIENIQKCIDELDDEKTSLDKQITRSETEVEHFKQDIFDLSKEKEKQNEVVNLYKDIYNQEKQYQFIIKDENDEKMILNDLVKEFNHKKTMTDYQNQLQRVYFEQNTYLSQYNIIQENVQLCHEVEDIPSRIILKATHQGKKISFLQLIHILVQNIEMQEMLIVDEDRHIFEEILVNTIGKKIRERIQTSRRWVEKIQNYMNDMNTSSGLQLSLKWKSRKAVDDQQLDTQQLVELLETDYHVLKDSDRLKISNHFRSKIATARKMSQDENTTASFHQLMKEVMDYRQWFDFTLYAKKPNENRKELTSHVFYAYSGGEKALSMYVPLFSAVAAKFESARHDAPLLIALDEAFAGVDENNIDNMFELITKFGFDYIMNSQVLWGDYPSCPSLAIYELFRPNNAPFVTVIAYIWNGHQKRLKYS